MHKLSKSSPICQLRGDRFVLELIAAHYNLCQSTCQVQGISYVRILRKYKITTREVACAGSPVGLAVYGSENTLWCGLQKLTGLLSSSTVAQQNLIYLLLSALKQDLGAKLARVIPRKGGKQRA